MQSQQLHATRLALELLFTKGRRAPELGPRVVDLAPVLSLQQLSPDIITHAANAADTERPHVSRARLGRATPEFDPSSFDVDLLGIRALEPHRAVRRIQLKDACMKRGLE